MSTEPVFVIKGKDALALPAIRAYFTACLDFNQFDQAAEVKKAVAEFAEWQKRNPIKLPDHQHVPATPR